MKSTVRNTIANLNKKQIAVDREKVKNNFKIPENPLSIFDMFCRTPELNIATITDGVDISRQAVVKIVNKLSDLNILSKVNSNQKWRARYRYNAICGCAEDFSINNTGAQNPDGMFLYFNGKNNAERQADTKTKIKFKPYKYHNKKPRNAVSGHKLYISDNIDCMKSLISEYEGTFDLIYFDPPYRMTSTRIPEAFADYFDGTCELLAFLFPRLKLAQRLLKSDGMIAVSIFENEMHYLKCLMDGIYGRKNIVNNVAIKTSVTAGPVSGYTKNRLPNTKSYLLIYAKDKNKVSYLSKLYEPVGTNITTGFNTVLTKANPENPVYTKTKLLDYLKQLPDIVNLFQKHNLRITIPNITILMEYDDKFAKWIYTDLAKKLFKKTKPVGNPLSNGKNKPFNAPAGTVFEFDGRLLEKSPTGVVYEFKCFSDKLVQTDEENVQTGGILGDIWDLSSEKSRIQKEGNVSFYSAKKPTKLIRLLLKLISGKKCDKFLIGDFFAGSASTFEAVISMNKDGIRRDCILCQLNEEVQPGSEEYKAGFRHIPQITIKRMKEVVKKHPGEGFQIYK